MKTYQEALLEIYSSISRKKANFDFVKAPPGSEVHSTLEFSLIAGSYRAIQGHGGFIVTMGITRERLTALRDLCNELLGES